MNRLALWALTIATVSAVTVAAVMVTTGGGSPNDPVADEAPLTIEVNPSVGGGDSALTVEVAPSGGSRDEDSEALRPPAPEFEGIVQWINSEPQTMEQLRGKVVLIDFWTYSCINCIRTLPHLRSWHEKYAGKGLVMVGVHTPEFDFEKSEANVREAVVRQRVTWPVAMDNDFKTWRAYENRYWPHKYLIDGNGIARYDHIGEGAYFETEQKIRELLRDIGADLDDIPTGGVETGRTSRADITRELYAGFNWAFGLYLGNSRHEALGQAWTFKDLDEHADGKIYLNGDWQINEESVQALPGGSDDNYVAIEYQAASVNSVIRPQGKEPFLVRVSLDGAPVPEALRGDDVRRHDDGETYLRVDAPRLYNVIRDSAVASHDLRLHSQSPDFHLYTFTFGR